MKSLAIYKKNISKGNWGVWIGLQCSVGSVMLLLVIKDREDKYRMEKNPHTRTSHLVHR